MLKPAFTLVMFLIGLASLLQGETRTEVVELDHFIIYCVNLYVFEYIIFVNRFGQ